MPAVHAKRREAAREALRAQTGAVPLLVTNLTNVRYLTGFSGSNALLLLGASRDGDLIATDGRYVDQVATEAPDLPAAIDRATLDVVLDVVAPGAIMVERTLASGSARIVQGRCGEPIEAPPVIEQLRSVKDDEEVRLLTVAASATAKAFEDLAGEIRPGVTELTLARRLEQLFAEYGGEDRAFATIVASGPNAAIPHHQPTARPLCVGDLLVIDAGARVQGYHADMSRTWLVGTDPEPWQSDLHAAVALAQGSALTEYRAGRRTSTPDAVAREVLRQHGCEERFTHGLGHGVGLEIHEAPMIGARATGSISASMVCTVEPGVYLPGRGGVRIEDTLVVTDAGPCVLTEGSRDLRVVGV